MNASAAVALDLIRKGLAVVPMHPVTVDGRCACGKTDKTGAPACSPGKHPRWTAGNHTRNAGHWNGHPGDGVGIDREGSHVVTVEDDGDLPKWLAATGVPTPDTFTMRSPSGRERYVYRLPEGVPPGNYIKPDGYAVDILGKGRAPGPGVRRLDGVYVIARDLPVADAPPELITWLAAKAAERAARETPETPPEAIDFTALPAELRDRLADVAPADRSAALFGLVSACRGHGLTQGQAFTLAASWAPAVDKYGSRLGAEVASCWGKVATTAERDAEGWAALGVDTAAVAERANAAPGQPAGPEPPSRPRSRLHESVLPLDALRGDPPPTPPYVLDSLLREGELATLVSAAKAGKSLLTLDRVLSAVVGGRRIVYLDAENGLHDLHTRVHALGYAEADLSGLTIVHFPALTLDDPAGAAELVAFIAELGEAGPVDGVVLDTASRFLAGDENDSGPWLAQYRQALQPLKRAGVAVLRLDHLGKDATKGARGSSAKLGDVDTIWELFAEEPNRAGHVRLELHCKDQRAGTHERHTVLVRSTENGVLGHRKPGTVAPGGVMPISDPGDLADRIVAALDAANAPIETGRAKAEKLVGDKFPGTPRTVWETAARRRKRRGEMTSSVANPPARTGSESPQVRPAREDPEIDPPRAGSGQVPGQVGQVRAGSEFSQVAPARAGSGQVGSQSPPGSCPPPKGAGTTASPGRAGVQNDLVTGSPPRLRAVPEPSAVPESTPSHDGLTPEQRAAYADMTPKQRIMFDRMISREA